MSAPLIYRLTIERFRCIKTLSWYPAKGVNVVLGGGDVGKTTIIDAIALLLSPTNPATLADTDYNGRSLEAGFSIEAIMSLPSESAINQQTKPSWPWGWNGTDVIVPSIDGDDAIKGEPVYRLRVRGTEDLELVYEIVQPDGNADNLSVGLRRNIGLVRLSGDDRNDRDLRLVQGSALDRLLSDKVLRSRLASELAKSDVADHLVDDKKNALKALDQAFKTKNLPHELDLAITGGQGLSITALIGLTANREGVQLPLANWGSGTRRFAALAIAEQNQGKTPITLVDEVERGLEPYRQRVLMNALLGGQSQVFVTTHSPSTIAAASGANLWYIDHIGNIGKLESKEIARHSESDPETFLARLAVVAEGVTELGFASVLLTKAFDSPLTNYGVHLTDGGGHDAALGLLEALAEGGLRFAGFADDEGKYPIRWQNLAQKLDKLLFRWKSGCTEQNVIGIAPDDKLEEMLIDPEHKKTGMRLRTLQERLGIQGKDFATIRAAAGPGLRALIVGAATGTVPADKVGEKNHYRSHGQIWFKTMEGGRELADKVFTLGLWPTLKPELLPFCNAVRKAVDLEEIPDLTR